MIAAKYGGAVGSSGSKCRVSSTAAPVSDPRMSLKPETVRALAGVAALLGCVIPGLDARAGRVLDTIRAQGVVHCGASLRPGLALPASDGTWHGLEVDLCRAVAVAVLGPNAKIEFHGYTIQLSSFNPVRRGDDAVSFLTGSEVLYSHTLATVLPGPPIFYATSGVMVLRDSPLQHLQDARDKRVCAEPGTGPERSLNAWYTARNIPIHFFMFQESDEMLDAFYGGRCEAIAHETTSLAAFRLQAEADGHEARQLAEPLAAVPVMATTPRSDPDWAAIVTWTVETLLRGETIGVADAGGGPEPLPLAGEALGLAGDWQDAVLKAVGNYGDIYRRNLGSESPLDIPRGLNALWTEGGLFCPPFTE